jgi:hypothetical protein
MVFFFGFNFLIAAPAEEVHYLKRGTRAKSSWHTQVLIYRKLYQKTIA